MEGLCRENKKDLCDVRSWCTIRHEWYCNERFITLPTFYLGHLNIKAVEKETYLGYIINSDMSDDDLP